jgi:hypothetical protein
MAGERSALPPSVDARTTGRGALYVPAVGSRTHDGTWRYRRRSCDGFVQPSYVPNQNGSPEGSPTRAAQCQRRRPWTKTRLLCDATKESLLAT